MEGQKVNQIVEPRFLITKRRDQSWHKKKLSYSFKPFMNKTHTDASCMTKKSKLTNHHVTSFHNDRQTKIHSKRETLT